MPAQENEQENGYQTGEWVGMMGGVSESRAWISRMNHSEDSSVTPFSFVGAGPTCYLVTTFI